MYIGIKQKCHFTLKAHSSSKATNFGDIEGIKKKKEKKREAYLQILKPQGPIYKS